MKIAHLSDCYLPRLGGIEVQVHDLASRQRAAGHDVEVVTATPPPAGAEEPAGEGVAAEVPVHRLAVHLPYELPVHPRPGRPLRELFHQGGYDMVHVHAGVVSPFAWAGAWVAARLGLPTVVVVHCLWGPWEPLGRAADVAVRWSRAPVALAAVSDVAAEPLRRIAGPHVPVAVLPNGIDPAQWQVPPSPRDPDEVHVVGVMRLAARKRPLHLLRMLRQLRAVTPPRVRLRASILGEGPERRRLERYLARHAMTGWVRLPGRASRAEVREVFRRADVFATPADFESFGIAALEARTAGLPVVAKAHTGVRDFVRHEREGLLVRSDRSMIAALARLAADPALRASIAAHNRATPPPMGWDEVLRRTDDAYAMARALAATGPGGRGSPPAAAVDGTSARGQAR